MKKILPWLKRRLSERSTYIGLAALAGAFGLPDVARVVDHSGQIAAIVVGAGLVAASTSDVPAEPGA